MTKSEAMLLSSSTYKKCVFEGFSRLQQCDEFVDMTLAAEGHFVKVHKMLVSLASPYFKELLCSAPCQHPIIFLSGVSNEALGFILEYIYSGEVEVPAEKVLTLLKTAQALHITGLKNITPPNENEIVSQNIKTEHVLPDTSTTVAVIANTVNENFQLQESATDFLQTTTANECDVDENTISINNVINMPLLMEGNHTFENVRNLNTHGKTINITLDENVSNNSNGQKPVAKIEIISNTLINGNPSGTIDGQSQLPQLYTEGLLNLNNGETAIDVNRLIEPSNPTGMDIGQSNFGDDIHMSEDATDLPETGDLATHNTLRINLDSEDIGEVVQQDSLLYTVSNRGSIQLIMNRFMYYCHYQRDKARKRRWRCIDYRDLHCPAAIDTVGEQVVATKHRHCHPNHDQKIRKKVVKSSSSFFPTMEIANDFIKQKKYKRVEDVPDEVS